MFLKPSSCHKIPLLIAIKCSAEEWKAGKWTMIAQCSWARFARSQIIWFQNLQSWRILKQKYRAKKLNAVQLVDKWIKTLQKLQMLSPVTIHREIVKYYFRLSFAQGVRYLDSVFFVGISKKSFLSLFLYFVFIFSLRFWLSFLAV